MAGMEGEGLHQRAVRSAPGPDGLPVGGVRRRYHSLMPPTSDAKTLALAIAVPLLLGAIDGIVNNPNQPFYRDLKKPSWNPPGWLFGVAWSILYPVMGFASWLLWKKGGWKAQSTTLSLYALQLVVNLLWPIFFFGLHSIALALADIAALDGLLIACILSFRAVDNLASALFLPYLAWVAFATFLNYRILVLN